MTALAGEVEAARATIMREAKEARERKKRKREGDEGLVSGRRKTATSGPRYSGDSGASEDPVSPKTVKPGDRSGSQPSIEEHMLGFDSPHIATPTAELSLREAELSSSIPSISDLVAASSGPPLKGLKVVVIHVKDKLIDGLQAGDKILEELKEHDEEAQLGCEWIISYPGQSLYF
ncbi:putative camp phosphodiesterase class-ii protein [Phaeoacremonium minimum UCRPA7]|uniref:Putative camp phosphodiesterase class-ii protein n=1 Tax=Phaeoacremonium minimum (strain UCR-PA7) TaxID=1286976 RepID=R8BEX3_PHAM7|nr:putative camp phosphodiesterase class-ii protein [Phaeoacremonium minimum UCRPA7]EON97850.1 putative camp phosphodiesterase class-ii protein [Phaeoacremonium minimum UCRPA7]